MLHGALAAFHPSQHEKVKEGNECHTSAQAVLRIDSMGVSKPKISERAASKHCLRASPLSLPKLLLVALIFSTKAGIS